MSNKQHEPFRYRPDDARCAAGWEQRIAPGRCRASVSSDSWRSHQCTRAAKHPTDPGGPLEWCTTHSPGARAAAADEGRVRFERECEMRSLHHNILRLAEECCEALLDPECHQRAIDLARERQHMRKRLAELKALEAVR